MPIIPISNNQIDPVSGLTPTKTYKSPKINFDGPSHIGHIDENTNMGVNVDDYKKYVPHGNVYVNEGLEDARAYGQSTGEKWAHGVTKFLGKTGTAFLGGTVGSVLGLPNLFIENKSVYDTAFQRFLDNANEKMDEALPNYMTSIEKEEGFLQSLNNANFWANDVLSGLSFTAGAVLTELVWSAATAATFGAAAAGQAGATAGLVARAARHMKNFSKGASVVSKLNTASKLGKVGQAANIMRQIYTGAGYEGGVEARHHKKKLRDHLEKEWFQMNPGATEIPVEELARLEEIATGSANWVFAANLGIVGLSNMIALPRIFGPGIGTQAKGASRIARSVEGAAEKVGKTFEPVYKNASRLGKIAEGMYLTAKNPFVEGIWEEGMQNVANNTMISYTSKKYNPFGTEDAASLIESFGDSLAETYGSKEGWKEIGIGMIIGSIGSPNFRAYKRNEKTKKLERRQDEPIWTGGIAGEFQERNRARGEADRLSGLMNQYGEDKLIEFIKSNPEYLKSTRGMLEHTIRSAELNSELEQALEKGDIFNAKNVEHDIVHSYIMARIDGGFSSDLVDEFAKTVQDMDNVEFAETFNYNDMSESELLKRKRDVLGNFEKKVSDIKKAVDIVDSNFKGDLTDSKNKNIREALIYGASVMDNVDYRENEVAKQIENLTGVIYDKEQRGTEYKEEFQSDINKSLENNPKNKPEVQALVKDLNNLQKRRETFIKQYNYLFTSQGQQEYGQLQEEVMKDIIKGIKSEIEEEYKGTVIVKDNESGKTFKKYDKADGTSVMMEIGEDSKPVTGEEIKVTVDDTFVGKYDIVKNVGGRSLNKEHSQRLMKRLNEFKDPDELTKFIIDEITPLNLANHDLVLKKAREIFKKLTGEKLDSKNPRYVDKIYKDKQSGKRVLVRKDNNKEDSYYVKEIKEKDTTKNIATVTKQELADNFVFEKTWRDYKNKAARIGNLEQMITSKEAVLDQQKKDGKTYRKELKELQQRYRDLVEKLKSKERDRRATKKTIGEVQALLDSTQNMIEEIQGKVNESVSAQIKIKSELKYLYDRIVEETNQDTVVNLKDKVAAIEEDIKVNEEAIFSWKHLVESLKKLMNKLLAMFEQAQLYIEKTPQRVVAEYEAQVREELMDFMTKGSPSEVSMVDGKFVRTPSFEWYQRQRIANEQIKRRLDSKKAAITRAIERGLDAQGEYQVSLQRIEQAENQIDSFEKDNERLFEQLFMIEEEVKSLRQYLKKQALTIGGYTPVSKKKSNKPDTELNPAEKKYQDKDEVPSDRVNREEERSMWSGIKRNLRDVFRGLTGRHVEASGQLTSDKDQRRYYRWTSKNNLSSGKFYIKVVQAFEEDRDKITSQGYNFEDAYYALVTNKEGKYVAEDGTTSDTFNKNVHIWTSFPLETTDTKTFGDKYYVPQTLKQWQKMYPGVKSSEEGQILFENEKKQLVKQHQILRERIKNQIANGQEVIFKIVDKAVGVPNDPYQEDDVSISVTEALGHNNVEVIINTDEVMTFKGKTFVNLKRGLTFIYDTVTGNIYEAKPRKINENETNMIINMFKSFANRSVVKNKGFIDSKGAGQLFAKDGSVVGDMFKVLTDLAFWSGDNTNEDGTAINKNEDKAFHFVKNFSIDGVNNVPGGAIKIGKQTFQLFVITKDGNVALNRAIADENGDGALKDFLSERNINIRSKNLRSNDDYVEFTSVDENGVATYKIHKGENGGYKSYLLGNEADGNNNVLGISVIPSGVEQEVGFDQDGNAIIEEVPQVFNQYAIYALEDDFVAKQTTQAKEERPNPNFTELPDIKIGERVRVTVTNDKTKAVEQNGVLEKNEDGVFVQKEGNLSANTITSINAVSKTKEGVTDYNEVLLKHNKTVAVGRVQPIEKKEPVVTPVAPIVETKSTPTDIEAKKADIESKPSAPKKVSGYLKGKRGNTFSIVENNSDRSFFVIFNEEGDAASFEFSGDKAEGIAKRVFSDDISETVSGSMKTAVNVYTVEAGQLKKVDDVWTVVKKTKVAFEKIQTQESKPTTTKRGANIDPYRTPTKDQRGTENLVEAENWFKERFPNVDFNVVRHLIDGGYHGQFKNAAIYVYENAEVGTTYHEAFHVVTHLFLTKRERTSLYKEYRQRVPEAKNLSDSQIEEALAEEFRDYILSKETTGSTYDLNKYKTPLKRSFFQRLYDHIKNFIFGKPDTIAEVFEKIEANEYRNASPAVKFSENKVTLNRSFKTKDEAFTKAAMEGVNYFFFQALFSSENNVASLFTKESNRQLVKRLYDYSKDQIERRMGDLYEELQETTDQTDKDHIENAISGLQYLLDNWEFSTEHTSSLDKVNYSVVGLHKQFLSQYRIDFLNVENEISELNADSDPDNQWSNESIKISSKFSASKNIKLLLGTLIAVNEDNTSKLNILKLPQNADFGFTFNILANELAGVRSVGQMKTRILKLSQKHPHLNSLIRRLKLNVPVESITREDMLQQVQFVQTFAKTKNRYKFDITGANGKFKVIDSNSNSLKNKVLQQWKNNAAQLKTGYVTVEGAKVYDKDAFTTVGIVNSIEKALQTLRMLGIEFSNQDVVLQNESFKAEIIKKTESIRKQIISPKGQISIFNTEISTNTGGDLNYFLELEAQTTADFIENSHFNLDNNLVYDVTLNSYVSNILNDIDSSQTLDEFFSEHPHLDPENNPYTANSVLLKKDGLFFDKNGRLKRQIELEIHEGSREEESGVSKEFDDFNQPDQLRVHINRGLQGAYPLLRPADNSIERYINVGKPVLSSAEIANEEYIPIFFNYLRDELIRSKDIQGSDIKWDNISDKANQGVIISILSKNPQLKEELDAFFESEDVTIEDFFSNEDTVELIQDEVRKYFANRTDNMIKLLVKHGIVDPIEGGEYYNNGLNIEGNPSTITSPLLKTLMRNYIINDTIMNIEQTKILFGDPINYKNVEDQFKRHSGLVGTKKISAVYQEVNDWIERNLKRTDRKTALKKDGQPIIRTAVFSDVVVKSKYHDEYVKAIGKNKAAPYEKMDEGDGQGYITIDEWREMLFRAGDWSFGVGSLESLYQYEIQKEAGIEKPIDPITKRVIDPNLLPVANSLKPQHFGPLAEDGFVVGFYKLSVFPLLPSVTKEFPQLENLRKGMKRTGTGIAVFKSANKVGTKLNENGKVQELYNDQGEFAYQDKDFITQDTYYKHWGIQVDMGSKTKKKVVSGTQMAKQIINGIYENGQPKNEKLGELTKEYLSLNAERITIGLAQLVDSLGMKIEGSNFRVENPQMIIDRFKKEAIERELPDNIVDAIDNLKLGTGVDTLVNREKIENIMFAIADSMTTSQKRSGSAKVQVSNAVGKLTRRIVNRETGQVWDSSDLKFYTNEDGKITQMEVYVPAYFRGKVTDSRLLDLIGFRIPTQGLNSIDSIKVAGFLPDSAGDSIIVPSEIVAKAGSDFDIDKLNIYYPNIYYDRNGNPKYIEFKNEDQLRKDYKEYEESFKVNFVKRILNREEFKGDITDASKILTKELQDVFSKEDFTINDIIEHIETRISDFESFIQDGTAKQKALYKETKAVYENILDLLYKVSNEIDNDNLSEFEPLSLMEFKKRGIENRISEIQKEIILHPDNFNQLITPISAKELSDEAKLIRELQGKPIVEKAEMNNIVEREYLLDVATRFIGGKKAVGITAVHSTFDILSKIYNISIVPSFTIYSIADKKRITISTAINLPHNINDRGEISLSKLTNAFNNGNIPETLSQWINAAVDAAKDPFMFDLNAGPETLNTVLYLTMSGVPLKHLTRFMTQPIIVEFIENRSKWESQMMESNTDITGKSKKKFRDEIVNLTKAKYVKHGKKPSDVSLFTVEQLEANIKKGARGTMDAEFAAQQLQVLDDFLRYVETAKKVGEAIRGVDYDTNAAGKNTSELLYKTRNTKNVKDEAVIVNFDKIFDTGFISPYYEAVQELNNIFRPFFITLKDTSVTKQFDKLFTLLFHERNNLSKEDKIKVLDKFKQSFITYLFLTRPFSMNNKLFKKEDTTMTMNSQLQRLFKGNNSIAHRLQEMKKKYPDMEFLKYLEPVISEDQSSTHHVISRNKKMDVIESNRYTNEWRELFNKEEQFAVDLMMSTLIQYGIENSPFTFTNLIPFEVYGDMMNSILQRESQLSEQEKDGLYDDFYNQFFLNNYNDDNIVPRRGTNLAAFYPFAKDVKVKPEYKNKEKAEEARSRGINIFDKPSVYNQKTNQLVEKSDVIKSYRDKKLLNSYTSNDISISDSDSALDMDRSELLEDYSQTTGQTLGSKKLQPKPKGKQFQKLTAEEKAKTIEQVTKEHRSIVALKDLSAKLAHRIGGTVEFKNRTDVDWKGYNQGMTSVLNEAYMTPDTPFHEILAHPIIRAIKKSKPELYQSLLKELETGRGKEVFEQVKRDYKYKQQSSTPNLINQLNELKKHNPEDILGDKLSLFSNLEGILFDDRVKDAIEALELKIKNSEKFEYSLEEQQEEAIVTLLGLMAAEKLDAKKDATLISKLKELWKQISDFVKSLLRQDGIKIDELPITTTLNDLAEIMAYGNNKIILPGYKIEYSTPLGNKYETLEEVNNEIKGLADANVEVDLSNINIITKIKEHEYSNNQFRYFTEEGVYYKLLNQPLDKRYIFSGELNGVFSNTHYISEKDYNENLNKAKEISLKEAGTLLQDFISKNKEYEQSKEIIEQWKKENNIQYDPEEVYSRGQGFYSSIGAYSNLELDLLFQNLLQHIQDNKKAGGEFTISAFTKPIDKRLKHIEGTGDRVRFVIYPKSEHIKWAAPTDVYSGSVWDAHEKVSKDKKSELLGVSFTKAPALRNINEVSPNLADIIDNLSHAHNELGIELTTNNFRIEYDDNIDYSTKKLIDNINKVLDDKYGKLEKPEVKVPESKKITKFRVKGEPNIFNTREEAQALANKLSQIDYMSTYVVIPIQVDETIGKQPTQTRENTTSIESVKNEVLSRVNYAYTEKRKELTDYNYSIGKQLDSKGYRDKYGDKINNPSFTKEQLQEQEELFKLYEEGVKKLDDFRKSFKPEKEYTSQAETNLKIAALKEVARKYPRSLITSKVVPINPNLVGSSEIQYSKVGSKQDIEGFREFINSNNNPVWEQGDNEFNRITGQAKNKNSLFSVAKSFNIQTSGFFPAQISKELLRQELNKKGFKNITIATASSGNLYLKDSKGFIKLDRLQSEYFQLSTGSQESSDSQLNDKIKAWLRKAGITYQSVENITDRKGNPVSAIAKADMLHKIVQVVEGKADITTLPEEAAHFLVELLPEDSPLLRGMMNAIVGTDIYNEVVSEYSELYNGDQTMLKKEAVGKMIAKAIVRKEQVSRMSSFQRFWDAAWRWIKRHLSFLKSSDIETELAPFMEAADMVLGNVTDGLQNVNDLSERIFYQVTTEGQAKEAKQIIEGFNQNKVTKDLTKGGYVTLEGKKVFNRVTDSVKEFYKRKFRKNVEDKPYNVTLALKGTILHKYLELAGEKIFNGEKVYWKEVESQVIRQLKDKNDAANVDFLDKNDAFFKLDENQFGELINGLNKIKEQVINKQKMIDPKGEVKFFPELLIYDQLEDVAGTIDLAVVYSNGTVGIYDYKGIDFNESQKLPLYKDQAYELQISLYKKILARAYGVKNFGETRIIPIDMKMTRTGAGYGKIAMGSTGLNDTKRPYLEQIPVDREMTDDAQLNISLTKMLNLHDKLAKQLSSDWKNEKLINRVERLKEAIRGLQLRGDVGFIFHEINSMYIDFNTRENLTEDSPYYMTLEYLSEVRETIEVYRKFGTNAMATAKKRESKETITNLERVAHMLDAMEQRVDQKVIEQLNKGENFNVEGKARAEGFTGRMFKQLSRFNRPTFKKLSKIVREVSDTVRKEVQETVEDVTEKTEALRTWAESKGMSLQDAFDKIINPETGDLTSQYSKEFYESRDKAIKDKDKKWFLKNANVEEIGGNLYYTGAAKERFEKAKKEMFEYIDKTNEGDQLKEFRERRKQEWLSKYDITIKTEALFNNNNYFIKPENITSNFSKEYNYMLQPENKPLLDYYVMYTTYNMKFAEMTGKDINKYFVAEISKDLIDRVGQVGLNGLGEMRDSLLRALEVRDFDIVLGSIDPATGKPMSVIPMLFTDKLTSRLTSSEKKKIREEVGSEFQIGTKEYEFEVEKREKRLEYTKGTKSKSRDLSRSLVLFADVAYSYAHLNETEAAALALRDIMKTQGQETEIIDAAGKTVIDKFTKKAATMMGVPLSEIEAMESFINAYWYGQTTQGTDLSVKVGDKSYSLTKAYRMLMKFTSAAALGLKPILSAGNLLGLTSNYYMTGAEGSYYKKHHMRKTNGMLVRKDPLFIGAVGFFEPFVHNLTLEKANNLSVSKLVSVVTFENVFILYKKGDELIDNCILGSMMQNYGIEDGKIKRIDKIQGEDKRSLLDRSSIVNDKFVVEGLTSEAYTHFRSMVQRAAVGIKGNMPSEDRNLIGTTLAGQALMHFRSWMPGLIEKRFKGLQYDDVFDDYDVGRFRVFFGEFSGKTVPSKLKAFANLLGEMAMMNIYDKKGVNMEVTQKFYDRHMQENPDSKLTMDEFVELRKAKLRGMAKELQIYLGFLAMVFLGRAALPDDEDEFANKTVRLLAQNAFRVTQRGLLELSFFFDPSSVTTILNRPLPTLTIINNTVKMLINTVDETRDVIFGKDYKGRIFWEEDKNDKTPRLYYFSKVVPIATSFGDFFDIFDTFNKNSKF